MTFVNSSNLVVSGGEHLISPSHLARWSAQLWLAVLLLAGTQAAAAHDYLSVASSGASIAYTDYGSGEPVILLHGFASDYARALGKIGDLLSRDFRVIGIDQRGHGRSDRPHGEDAYGKHMASDVLAVMDKLRIPKAHVVGHSMGGAVAMYLVANHPDRFLSAVTIGNGLFTQGELTLIGWLMRGSFAWNRVKALFGGDDPYDRPENDRVALLLVVASLKELAVTQQQAVDLKVPVLALRGGPEDDPRDTVERLAAVNPSVKMIRVESEDHMSMLTSKKLEQEIKAFLQRTPG